MSKFIVTYVGGSDPVLGETKEIEAANLVAAAEKYDNSKFDSERASATMVTEGVWLVDYAATEWWEPNERWLVVLPS